ncbi:hypothetical protein Pelo_860 [Pelomyxa schiedti]|nr:hypothetical protein Pelo_860 [Pelomyxa schiedti]
MSGKQGRKPPKVKVREGRDHDVKLGNMVYTKPTPKFLQGLQSSVRPDPKLSDKWGPTTDGEHAGLGSKKPDNDEEDEPESVVVARLLEEKRREREQYEEIHGTNPGDDDEDDYDDPFVLSEIKALPITSSVGATTHPDETPSDPSSSTTAAPSSTDATATTAPTPQDQAPETAQPESEPDPYGQRRVKRPHGDPGSDTVPSDHAFTKRSRTVPGTLPPSSPSSSSSSTAATSSTTSSSSTASTSASKSKSAAVIGSAHSTASSRKKKEDMERAKAASSGKKTAAEAAAAAVSALKDAERERGVNNPSRLSFADEDE